jgi:hypothetical protein
MFAKTSLLHAMSSGRRRRLPLRPVLEELEPRLNPTEVGLNDFRLSFMGPDGNPNFAALNPAVAYNSRANEYLVVWQGDDVTDNEQEIFGQRVSAATGATIGGKIRISDMGPDGDTRFGAYYPAVAYNSVNNEYLVVWHGTDNTAPLVNEEYEIFGQRIDAATGAEVGANDFRISDMGPDGNTFCGGLGAAVAYNPTNNEYLVVWHGDDNTAPLVEDEFEIFGQRLDAATGAFVGAHDFRISDMGPNGNPAFDAFDPAVAYNGVNNEYLVVWQGDDTTDNEQEIYGQRLNAATGAEVGANDFRISDMGPDGNTDFAASNAAVAYNGAANEYLVVWGGDDNIKSDFLYHEYEIYGQRLSATGAEVGDNDFRISDMGDDGFEIFGAFHPAVAYNAAANEYLVAWEGHDNTAPLVYGEFEIFGQRLRAASAAPIGANDFRISDMGPDGDTRFGAAFPAVASNGSTNEYLVVWMGDDDTAPLVEGEYEIFGQRLNTASGPPIGFDDSRISFMGPEGDVAYNATNNEYLVVWAGNDWEEGIFGPEIYGQRIDAATGALLGSEIRISDLGLSSPLGFNAFEPAVAYNATNNEYLVVWSGEKYTARGVPGEYEIFGQRLDAATGAQVGANDFRLSDMGPDGDTRFEAGAPAVAYNGADNEYLVVWSGDDTTDEEFEVFGQRLDAATGAEVGANDFRISQFGPDGDTRFIVFEPAVAYNGVNNEYLVVWHGDDFPAFDDQIYGQRLNAATGAEVGTNDFRISDMNPDGINTFGAAFPAVAYNGADNEYLVVWSGDDTTDEEFEVFGQRLNAATGAQVGANDFRISDMGPDGDTGYGAVLPKVAYNGAADEYLVAWWGDDNTGTLVNDEYEVFGQRLNAATGAEVGDNDFRISDMGPNGDIRFGAFNPVVAYSGAANEYLVVWHGDNTKDNEFEIFGQRLAQPQAPPNPQFPPPNSEVEIVGQRMGQPDTRPIMAAAFRGKGVTQVRVTDAATGELRAVLTPFKRFRGRLRLRMEDVNGDGTLELVVRALVRGRRQKKVYDAVTLAPLPPGLA